MRGHLDSAAAEEQQPTRRDRRRIETRERIFDAAVALFVENGYAATTMDDIAERADTARRTAFNHFASKGDITIEWANRRRARAAAATRDECGEGRSALVRLRAYFRELARITEAAPEETRQMVLGWLGAYGPVYNRSWLPQELRGLLESEGAGTERTGRDDADPTTAAEVLFDVYLGVIFRWVGDQQAEPGSFSRDLEDALNVVVAGIDPAPRDHSGSRAAQVP